MTEVISVADAKRRFSELIERVGRGEQFVVTRRGKPVLALLSPEGVLDQPEKPTKRGMMAVWGILEGVEGAEEWYEEMQRVIAARRDYPPRPMPYFDDL